jgi:hypothetical protein
MSQEIDLEGKSQYSHTIDRSNLRNSSTSYSQKENVDIYCELEAPCSGSPSPSEMVYHLHAQDDFPDGGLRAWLVVLGVRLLLLVSGHWAADELYFRVHVQLSQRELLYAIALF